MIEAKLYCGTRLVTDLDLPIGPHGADYRNMISTVQNLKRLAGAYFFFLNAILADLIQPTLGAEKIQKSWAAT